MKTNPIRNRHRSVDIRRQRQRLSPAAVVTIVIILLLLVVVIKPTITGNATRATSTLRVSGLTFAYNCNLTLANGWNLFSMPCDSANASVTVVLSGISGSYYSIHSYDPADPADHWKSYNPTLPSWVDQDLKVINVSRGYWIRMAANASLPISGTLTLPTTVHLIPGWNLIGFPTSAAATPESLFASINSSIVSVHAYNATDLADNWKAYYTSISGSLNDLTLIVPYWGYWINATSAANWNIPLG